VTATRHRWLSLGVAVLGTLMAVLDTSIVNVAVPAIMKDFGRDIHEIEWVVTAYMIGFAAFMPLTAWLRTHYGIRRAYLTSLACFVVGSVACALAPGLGWLIAARILQSLAASALTPTGMAIVSEAFAPAERGRALGLWGLGAVIGPALGPPLGGVLTEAFGWRAIFTVNIPIGVLALAMTWKVLRLDSEPTRPGARPPFDVISFLSLTGGIVALMLFVNQGGVHGWSTRTVAAYGLVALASAVVFTVSALKTRRAVIDLSLFRVRAFTAAAVISAVRSVVLFGTSFLLPLFLQGPRGLSVEACGMLLLPGAVAIGLAMPLAGRAHDRFGARLPAIAGIVLMLVAMLELAALGPETSFALIILPTVIRGVGIGLLVTPVMAIAMNTVPRGKEGMASSILNLIQQLSGSLGIALLSAYFNGRIDDGGPELAEASRRILGGLFQEALTADALASVTDAFRDTYLWSAALVAVALVPALWLPRRIRGSVTADRLPGSSDDAADLAPHEPPSHPRRSPV
jgi:EmrB/QacA subfamily drug resistance transporter